MSVSWVCLDTCTPGISLSKWLATGHGTLPVRSVYLHGSGGLAWRQRADISRCFSFHHSVTFIEASKKNHCLPSLAFV